MSVPAHRPAAQPAKSSTESTPPETGRRFQPDIGGGKAGDIVPTGPKGTTGDLLPPALPILTRWQWAYDMTAEHGLPGVQSAVLVYTAYRDSGDGMRVKQDRMARETGIGVRSIGRALAALRRVGVLHCKRRSRFASYHLACYDPQGVIGQYGRSLIGQYGRSKEPQKGRTGIPEPPTPISSEEERSPSSGRSVGFGVTDNIQVWDDDGQEPWLHKQRAKYEGDEWMLMVLSERAKPRMFGHWLLHPRANEVRSCSTPPAMQRALEAWLSRANNHVNVEKALGVKRSGAPQRAGA